MTLAVCGSSEMRLAAESGGKEEDQRRSVERPSKEDSGLRNRDVTREVTFTLGGECSAPLTGEKLRERAP